MKTSEQSVPRDIAVSMPLRGLAWLALGNLVCVAAITAISFAESRFGFSPWSRTEVLRFNANLVVGALITGQVHAWAIIWALLPQRRFVSLVATIAFALTAGAIQWGGVALRAEVSATNALPLLWAGLLCLGVFAIAQGLRLLCGQRLVPPGIEHQSEGKRFTIADVIEWTVTIGVLFGIGNLTGWNDNIVLLIRTIAWLAIVTLPLALSIVSRSRRRWLWISAVVCLALVATVVRDLGSWHYTNPTMLRLPLWVRVSFHVTIPASLLVATACNFSVLRRLGFRWTGPGSGMQARD